MDSVLTALGALAPPAGVALIFWLVLRSIIRADRSERAAIARLDAEERGLVPRSEAGGTPRDVPPDATAGQGQAPSPGSETSSSSVGGPANNDS